MVDKKMYFDFCRTMFKKMCGVVNGKIEYDAYPDKDFVVFKVSFKEFVFKFAIDQVTDHIYNCDSDRLIEEFTAKYKRALLNAFFKKEDFNNVK